MTGVGTRGGDEILVAVVVADGPVEADALLDFCRGRLTDYKVPHRIVFRDALPRSPLGKVLRRDLDLATEQASARQRTDEPPAETTGYLVGQLARLLRVPAERIDVTAPILATGLNSLMAMQLRLAIERDLGVPAQLGTLLGAHSLADVAARLADSRQPPGAALLPAAGPPEFPLSAAQLPYVSAPAPWAAHLFAARVDGDVDEVALRAAFQALVDRHPMLRLAVDTSGSAPAQRTAPRLDVDFAMGDVPPAGLADRMAALAAAAAVTPGPESSGPLHVRLLRDGDRAPVLAVGVHRIAADRWSLAVLFRDLAMVLNGQRSGDDPYLPALPYGYRDFVQRSTGEPPAGALFVLSGSPDTRTTESTLDHALTVSLRRLARQEGVSLSSLLLGAVTAAAGSARVTTVHFGRDRPEFHDLVGRFARVVSVPGGADLPTLLPAARDVSALPAVDPADRLQILFVDDVGPYPALTHLMRFVAPGAREAVALGNLRLRPVTAEAAPLSAPIECRLTRVADTVTVLWRYGVKAAGPVATLEARFHDVLRTAAPQTVDTR